MIGTEYSEYKLLHHKEALLKDRPPFCMWDLTCVCNHNCKWCVSKYKELYNAHSEWDFDRIASVAEGLRDIGVKAIHFTGGGEPLVYKQFPEVVKLLFDMGFQLSIVTNGVLLDRIPIDLLKRFTWIRISIDAIRDETYQIVRGAKSIVPIWDVVERILPQLKKSPITVGASFVVFDENVSEIHSFLVWAKSRGFHNCRVSYGWSPEGMTISDETRKEAMHQLNMVAESKIAADKFQIFTMRHRLLGTTQRTFKRCYYSDAVVVIGADGEVYRCCVLKYKRQGKLGSLYECSMQDIWKNRGIVDATNCPMCYADTKSNFAQYLMCPDPKHVNFI